MKKILLLSAGIFHPPLTARIILRRLLEKPGEFKINRIHSIEKLPGNLNTYAAIILYMHHKNISPEKLAQLQTYVSRGGGILGIHSATASYKTSPEYFRIMGGRFTGHGKVEPFEVTPRDNSFFKDIPAFTIRDELYLHKLDADIEVHFTSRFQEEEIPTVWTHNYGSGRICYVVPGHTAASLKHPAIQDIITQGLQWVCT